MARQTSLPPTLAPRLVGREVAAAYLSLSPGLFDDLVKVGLMPSPKKLGERRLAWDVRELDAAVDRLPPVLKVDADLSWRDIDAA